MFQEQYVQLKNLEKEFDKFDLENMLSGEYDKNDAILTIISGAGGTDAQDWTQMLFRMYSRYADKLGWKYEILDSEAGTAGGFSQIEFMIKGVGAYSKFKYEKDTNSILYPFDCVGLCF